MIKRSRIKLQLLLATLMTVLVAVFAANAEPKAKEKTSQKAHFDPIVKDIEGWNIHIDPKLLEIEHAEEGGKALKMLASHLQRIAIMIPNTITLRSMWNQGHIIPAPPGSSSEATILDWPKKSTSLGRRHFWIGNSWRNIHPSSFTN
jgi:hypothetical protein